MIEIKKLKKRLNLIEFKLRLVEIIFLLVVGILWMLVW